EDSTGLEKRIEQLERELESAVATLKTVVALKNNKIKSLEANLCSALNTISMRDCVEEKVEEKEMRGVLTTVEDQMRHPVKENAEKKEKRGGVIAEKFEGTINARFTKISRLGDDEVLSQPARIAGVDWTISISRTMKKDMYYLEVNLNLLTEDLPNRWSCAVLDKYEVVSQLASKYTHSKTAEEPVIYSRRRYSYGYDDFIPFKTLMNPKYGLVKNDSILIFIHVRAFPSNPQ
ncbi:hypothetical protein PFISCL1PPCAC_20312, partial [Pristionchus fissidentatus]